MVPSHFASIGGLEIYTGEGETHPQEVLNHGKQSAGSRPAFSLACSPLMGPVLTLEKPEASLDKAQQHDSNFTVRQEHELISMFWSCPSLCGRQYQPRYSDI